MSSARDLLMLSMMAFKEGQYEGSAKFFAEAMGADDLTSFVDYVAKLPDDSGLHGGNEESENTLSPSLASAQMTDADLKKVADAAVAAFLSENASEIIVEDEAPKYEGEDEDEEEGFEEEDNSPLIVGNKQLEEFAEDDDISVVEDKGGVTTISSTDEPRCPVSFNL